MMDVKSYIAVLFSNNKTMKYTDQAIFSNQTIFLITVS